MVLFATCGISCIGIGVTCCYCKGQMKKSHVPHLSNAAFTPDVIYEDPVGMKYTSDEQSVITEMNIAYALRPK